MLAERDGLLELLTAVLLGAEDATPKGAAVLVQAAQEDDSVVIRVLARTRPGLQWEVARAFRLAIKKRLDEEGIDIPFPQQTVHLRVGSPADELARAAEQVARGVRKADKA